MTRTAATPQADPAAPMRLAYRVIEVARMANVSPPVVTQAMADGRLQFGRGIGRPLIEAKSALAFVESYRRPVYEQRPAQLYRHFDGDGRLLYVGISTKTIVRLAKHKKNAPWFDAIRKITIEVFDTGTEAAAAEAAAIRSEGPLYNIVFSNRGGGAA